MKIILLILVLAFTKYSISQKIVSYKFEKEKSGKSLFGGRMVASVSTEYKKIVPTTFIFDLTKKTIRIGNKVWEITVHESYKYIGYNKGKTCEVHLLPLFKGDAGENQILIEYDNGERFRYYFKSAQWKMPE